MIPRLLILFILIPLVELFLLVAVASRIQLPATILLVVLTGAWGWYLAKSQGLSILAKIQSEMSVGRVPTAELVDGLLVLIGGIVLLPIDPYQQGKLYVGLLVKVSANCLCNGTRTGPQCASVCCQ